MGITSAALWWFDMAGIAQHSRGGSVAHLAAA